MFSRSYDAVIFSIICGLQLLEHACILVLFGISSSHWHTCPEIVTPVFNLALKILILTLHFRDLSCY